MVCSSSAAAPATQRVSRTLTWGSEQRTHLLGSEDNLLETSFSFADPPSLDSVLRSLLLPLLAALVDMKHRDEEATEAISKLPRLPVNDPLVCAEYLEIKAAVTFDEETESEVVGSGGVMAPWKALFAPNMFKRLVLGWGMMIFQQFTGINAVLYYAPQIFSSLGFSSTKTTLLATGVTGILQIIFTLPTVLYLDKFSRKTFLIAGATGMFLCHMVVAVVQGTYKPKWDLTRDSPEPSAGLPLRSSGSSLSTLLTLGEIFPNSQRSRGVSIVASTNWMFNFVIGLTTKDMLGKMKYGTYIFFAIFGALGGLFIWKFAPETKDKTVESTTA
ncbi:Major facilitator superfamily domain general substrate transporter [Penicillium mononematosum]|uniref:Major facilitator superfamily domain general substrate transporter n=1 Tax=Penicillium mononematosum TaxID=268346 RepID=UPI002548E869|nr:Major facilitator superfamily domain general substrate transporter [Penicillium mononematosum]KAJ6185556.1 Major facilitator superfamily domain general substrate transporter [Penicillium mononematosum]